jgi:hypothetical protein
MYQRMTEEGVKSNPLLAMAQLFPRLGEQIIERSGSTKPFRKAAEARGRA